MLGFSRGGRGSGCYFRPALGTRLGYVKESGFIKDFSGTAQICLGFSRGGRGSGCHFRPAVGTRLSYVQESGFIKDFSCTAQISLGFQLYRTNFIRISVVPHKFRVTRWSGLGISFSAGRGGPAGMSFSAVRPPGDTVPHKLH